MHRVIEAWRAYLQSGGEASATELGIQFIKNSEELNEMRRQFGPSQQSIPAADANVTEGKQMRLDTLAAILVGRLERFVFLEAKPRLKGAGLDNPDDFALLAALFFKPYISKGQLLKQSLIEPATGTEILKRMKKAGWIDEKPNPEDGRSLLVALTPEGQSLTANCFVQLTQIENTLDKLSFPEKVFLVSILEKLDQCHSERHGIKTIGTWMQEGNLQQHEKEI